VRVPVSRPRSLDDKELSIAAYEYFADRDPLQRAIMDRMLAGVSTRKFARVGEPVGEQVEQAATATAKSTVSEMFIEKTRTALGELMARRLDDMRLAVMMLDGPKIAGRVHVVALGITTDGRESPARAVGRLDGERHPRAQPARRPRRAAWTRGKRSSSSSMAARRCAG
jgi:putative transposase